MRLRVSRGTGQFAPASEAIGPLYTCTPTTENNTPLTMTEKPKRPMSAYMLWLNSAREQIKSENPGLKVTDIAKKGGEMWRAMKDKSVWEDKAAKAKEQYTKDLEAFNANGGGGEPKKAQKRGKKAAKKPATKTKKKKNESDEEESEEEEESD